METVIAKYDDESIKSHIMPFRGVQVMLDRDLAKFYGVTTKRLNEQVKRNSTRFPSTFMFQLTAEENETLRSQFATTNKKAASKRGGSRYLPYVFTEHGILMLASVLNSEVAVAASVRIMQTFVAMRKILASMAPVLARIEAVEKRQLKQEDAQTLNEERFEKIFDAMQDKRFPPQKLFFDGEFYDAFLWIKDMIKKAKTELIVIDPYFDASVLPLFADKHAAAKLLVVRSTRAKNKLPEVDVAKFNAQYSNTLVVKESDLFHDRFLIVDRKLLVHIGASLNYLGKKCFAASTFDPRSIPEMLSKLPLQ